MKGQRIKGISGRVRVDVLGRGIEMRSACWCEAVRVTHRPSRRDSSKSEKATPSKRLQKGAKERRKDEERKGREGMCA